MRYMLVIGTVLILAASPSRGENVSKLSLDDISTVSPKIEVDSNVKAEGKSAIKITVRSPTTVHPGEVIDLDVTNAKLLYKAKVKSDIDGAAFPEMWAHIGDRQYFSKGMNDAVSGKTEWKTIQTPFLFQQGQKPDKITLNIVINGKGTVWVDDIVLAKEPLQ